MPAERVCLPIIAVRQIAEVAGDRTAVEHASDLARAVLLGRQPGGRRVPDVDGLPGRPAHGECAAEVAGEPAAALGRDRATEAGVDLFGILAEDVDALRQPQPLPRRLPAAEKLFVAVERRNRAERNAIGVRTAAAEALLVRGHRAHVVAEPQRMLLPLRNGLALTRGRVLGTTRVDRVATEVARAETLAEIGHRVRVADLLADGVVPGELERAAKHRRAVFGV